MTETNSMAELLRNALSAKGGTRMAPQQLQEFAACCTSKRVVIHTVEAFEIKSDLEVARTDLSIYGPVVFHTETKWDERVKTSCDEARNVASLALSSNEAIIFQVWLDTE
jgi:hypothetical protein